MLLGSIWDNKKTKNQKVHSFIYYTFSIVKKKKNLYREIKNSVVK